MSESQANVDQADLLVELGCEELPPKTLGKLAKSFYEGVCKGLDDAGIEINASAGELFYTPRRMAFRIKSVSARQDDQVLDRKGPSISAAFDADGLPTPAALGFARSVDHEVEDLERQQTDKGEWLFCRVAKPGMALSEVLYPVMERALAALPVAKPMRWSNHDFSFVRPVHWLLVLHGGDVVDGSLFGQEADRKTHGHRVHNPGPHDIPTTDDYEAVLEQAFVQVDPDSRKHQIRVLAEKAGKETGGSTRITEPLLDEVSNIVEWPVAVRCSFDQGFLEVPQEALIASMEDHQKFFPVLDPESGVLTSEFVVISNIESIDSSSVKAGYERVIRPRLADASFFWKQDRKRTLEDYAQSLDAVVFQKDLGTVGDKSRRITAISKHLAEVIGEDAENASRAASLSKCDLVTQMVGRISRVARHHGGSLRAGFG